MQSNLKFPSIHPFLHQASRIFSMSITLRILHSFQNCIITSTTSEDRHTVEPKFYISPSIDFSPLSMKSSLSIDADLVNDPDYLHAHHHPTRYLVRCKIQMATTHWTLMQQMGYHFVPTKHQSSQLAPVHNIILFCSTMTPGIV